MVKWLKGDRERSAVARRRRAVNRGWFAVARERLAVDPLTSAVNRGGLAVNRRLSEVNRALSAVARCSLAGHPPGLAVDRQRLQVVRPAISATVRRFTGNLPGSVGEVGTATRWPDKRDPGFAERRQSHR